jgi:hypothetical protein
MFTGIFLFLGLLAIILVASLLRKKLIFCDYAFIVVAVIGMAIFYGLYGLGIGIIVLLSLLGLGFVLSGIWRKNKVRYHGNIYNVHNCYNCGFVTFRCTRCGYTRSALFEEEN